MTDKELCESVRLHRSWRTGDGDLSDMPHVMADRIEALSAEVERYREALREIDANRPAMLEWTPAIRASDIAREALDTKP